MIVVGVGALYEGYEGIFTIQQLRIIVVEIRVLIRISLLRLPLLK